MSDCLILVSAYASTYHSKLPDLTSAQERCVNTTDRLLSFLHQHVVRLISRMSRALTMGESAASGFSHREQLTAKCLRQLAVALSTDVASFAHGFAATLVIYETSNGLSRTAKSRGKKCLPLRRSRVTLLRRAMTKPRAMWSFGDLPGDPQSYHSRVCGTNILVDDAILGEYRVTILPIECRGSKGRLATALPAECADSCSSLPVMTLLMAVLRCIFACAQS